MSFRFCSAPHEPRERYAPSDLRVMRYIEAPDYVRREVDVLTAQLLPDTNGGERGYDFEGTAWWLYHQMDDWKPGGLFQCWVAVDEHDHVLAVGCNVRDDRGVLSGNGIPAAFMLGYVQVFYPEYRGRGIGTVLCQAMDDDIAAFAARWQIPVVGALFTKEQRFWAGRGWQDRGVVNAEVFGDEALMVKTYAPPQAG